ncbi:MAG: GGDEF domain-containing protein [Acidaminococcaceae bacterium]|nr:GGDEF domain-containing protein [Acidaminococcaceae bacterium]
MRPLTAAEHRLLTTVLPMFGRYLGVRVYRNRLAFASNSLESILDNTGIDIYVNDFYNHDILYANKSMAAPYGGIAQFLGRKCWEVLFPGQNGPCSFCPQQKLIDENGEPTKIYSWDYQRPFDGSWFRVFSAAFRWVDGRLAHVVSSADITENKHNEALIEYLANYDALTELPNRRMLVQECERRLAQLEDGGKGYLLFLILTALKISTILLGMKPVTNFWCSWGSSF